MKRHTLPALFVAMALVAPILAQQAQPQLRQRQPGQAPQPAQGRPVAGQERNAQANMLDQHIAACLIIGNNEEIQLNEFAQKQTGNDDVREFAEMMIKDHTKFVSQLQKFAPQSGSLEIRERPMPRGTSERNEETEGTIERREIRRQDDTNRQDENREPSDRQSSVLRANVQTVALQAPAAQAPAAQAPRTRQPAQVGPAERLQRAPQGQPGQAGQARAGSQSLTDQMLAFEKDKAQHCLSMTKQMLQEHKGADFDKAFIGQQISMHTNMLATLKAAEGKVSDELGEVLSQGQETTQQHLQHAKELMKRLDSAGARRPAVSERPDDPNSPRRE